MARDFQLTLAEQSDDLEEYWYVKYHIRLENNQLIGTLTETDRGMTIVWEALFGLNAGECYPGCLYDATDAIKRRIKTLSKA